MHPARYALQVGTRRFKAIELDAVSRQRTGRELSFEAATRDDAIELLLGALGASADRARVDPTRTLVELGGQRWTIVAAPPAPAEAAPVSEPASLRRGGAKHKRVR